MKLLLISAVTFLCCLTPLYAQIGLHLDNYGVGIHFLKHPQHRIAFETNASFGLSANNKGLMHTSTTLSNGVRWNFLRTSSGELYIGAKINLQLEIWNDKTLPREWAQQYSYKLNDRTLMNVGWTLPIGFSYLSGNKDQWEWHLETGVEGWMYNNLKTFGKLRPHLKVGTTYYFSRP